jgi:hypothetical protein
VQLFKQLPLSGAAAHASVPREVLQQMGLGLQLELQRVGAPVDLILPAELVAQQPEGSGVTQQAVGAAAAARQQPLPPDWSASEQVSKQPLNQWHCVFLHVHYAGEPLNRLPWGVAAPNQPLRSPPGYGAQGWLPWSCLG